MALPLAHLALALLAPARQEPVEAAARGARHEKTLVAALCERPDFLRRVVFRASVVLDHSALEPHIAGLLRAGDEPEALRLALRVMPGDLARAHAAKLWTPGAETVRVLLAVIEDEGLEREDAPLLQSLFEARDENMAWAGRLLLRAGGEVPFTWVAEQLPPADLPLRRAWIEACGLSGRKELALELGEWLSEASDASVLATGLVALAGLAHAPARTELEALVKEPASERRRFVLAALARVLASRELHRFAEEALRRDDLAPEERFALGAGLVRGGVPALRAVVRAALPTASVAERWSGLRALTRAPDPDDAEAFAAVFPLEGGLEDAAALEANALLATTLLAQRHAEGEPFLRAALWSDDWDLCVLAGGLIVRRGGMRALLDELEAAPRNSSEADLRRVGFALGEWGGLGVVEDLKRTRLESDPVLQGALLGALSARVAEQRVMAKEGLGAAPVEDEKAPRPKGEGGKRERAGKGPKDQR